MRVLITGGAGYIGSHTAKALARAGLEPVVYDNLSEGHRWAVKWGPLIEGDLSDRRALKQAIRQHHIAAAIHFAAHAYVGESVREPRRYFHNNVTNTLDLLGALLDAGVEHVVFSSSCAIYGAPNVIPISEDHSKQPINPYGESKLFIERVLDWYGHAYNLRWVSLRYFNAAGADPAGELGEAHHPETHLLPLVIEAAVDKRKTVEIFGTDYPTPDGTAIRDYVHVSDLAAAHVLALRHLLSGGDSLAVNLGTGRGVSVCEIVAAVERVTGAVINVRQVARRLGDPPILVADPARAERVLSWRPQFSSIESIVDSAWHWRSHASRIDLATTELPLPRVDLSTSIR